MSLHTIPLPDITISNGQTSSSTLLANDLYRDADALTFFGPETLPESTRIEVADNDAPIATDWKDLQRSGADVTIGPGDAITIELISWRAMRLTAASAVGGDRVFAWNKGVWV